MHANRTEKLLVTLLAAAYLLFAPTVDAGTVAATNAVPVQVPLSVFEELPNGKDPFFPNSRRRQPVVAIQQQSPTETVSSSKNLVLSGISGPVEKRLALINNRSFSAGETGEVKVPGGFSRIKCIEINENSVLIQVEGEGVTKELALKNDIKVTKTP